MSAISFKSDPIANEFLALPEAANQLSPMKLQKLVYFAHGWHLALTNDPLLNESIQAWKFGPVVYSLYREFKEFGCDPITRLAHDVRFTDGRVEPHTPRLADCGDSSSYARALIPQIWNLYGRFTASQLSTMTHAPGTPWHQIVTRFNGRLPMGIDIPNEMIRDYFKLRRAS